MRKKLLPPFHFLTLHTHTPGAWANQIRSLHAPTLKAVDGLFVSKILENAYFNVIVNKKEEEKGIVSNIVNSLFKRPIAQDPQASVLGGEKVLTLQHVSPSYDSSVHLMHFDGTQDKHVHPGPRVLSIFAGQAWSLYLGEQIEGDLPSGKLRMVKIAFPGESLTTLVFKKRVLHGFEGKDIGAISVHYTDKAEALEIGVSPEKLCDKDVLAHLTQVPDQSHIALLQSMTYTEAMDLQKIAAKGKLRSPVI